MGTRIIARYARHSHLLPILTTHSPDAISHLRTLPGLIFYVAKCNLGKVNLEAMLASSFPSYTRDGPMSLVGAPRG